MEYFDQLAELFEGPDGDLFRPKPKKHITTKDERLIESFERINDFVRKNGRIPKEETEDIGEATLGHMLVALKTDKKKIEELSEYDEFGLFEMDKPPESLDELFTKDGDLFEDINGIFDVSKLPNRGVVDRQSGETAVRKAIKDFAKYKKMFIEKQKGLASGKYKFVKFQRQEEVVEGGFYVSGGQMCYVESIGDEKMTFGRMKSRIRIIYENGTESNIFLRTLSSQLYHDDGFIVVKVDTENKIQSAEPIVGRLYVLKSKSEDTWVREIKDLYKIGMTEGSVEKRIANAQNDPTYLMAPVEIVDTFKITGDYNVHKVETLIHHFFSEAKVLINIVGKNGMNYTPEEWYSVPITVIREAVDLLNSGEISSYIYDGGSRKIIELQEK